MNAVGDLPSLAQAAAAASVAAGMQLLRAVALSSAWARKLPAAAFCSELEEVLQPWDVAGSRVSLQVWTNCAELSIG